MGGLRVAAVGIKKEDSGCILLTRGCDKLRWIKAAAREGRPIQLDLLRDCPVDRGAIARDRGKKKDGAQIYFLMPIELSYTWTCLSNSATPGTSNSHLD